MLQRVVVNCAWQLSWGVSRFTVAHHLIYAIVTQVR